MNVTDEELVNRTISYPIARDGLPEDIAYAAIFLASEASNYITGHTLIVDGGQSIPTEA